MEDEGSKVEDFIHGDDNGEGIHVIIIRDCYRPGHGG